MRKSASLLLLAAVAIATAAPAVACCHADRASHMVGATGAPPCHGDWPHASQAPPKPACEARGAATCPDRLDCDPATMRGSFSGYGITPTTAVFDAVGAVRPIVSDELEFPVIRRKPSRSRRTPPFPTPITLKQRLLI